MSWFSGLGGTDMGLIALGGLVGGLVNGLTGFGTGLSAMPVWLQVLPAPIAAQLAAAGGVAGQLSTLRVIWPAIDWVRLAPMLLAGLLGVPIGVALLPYVDARAFKRGVAVVLIGYSVAMLLAGRHLRVNGGGRGAEALVGLFGGVLGGLAGLSGVTPTVWAALKGWTKDQRRGVFQAFNLTILSSTLLAHLAAGLLSARFLAALALALPGTFLGVALGQALYRRLDDRGFDRAVLALLLAAGVGLLATTR
jgi:hypothetical protein